MSGDNSMDLEILTFVCAYLKPHLPDEIQIIQEQFNIILTDQIEKDAKEIFEVIMPRMAAKNRRKMRTARRSKRKTLGS